MSVWVSISKGAGRTWWYSIYDCNWKGVVDISEKPFKTKKEAKRAAFEFLSAWCMPCDYVCEWQINEDCTGCGDCKWNIALAKFRKEFKKI